jgi:aldehyde dehydrogenase (NAD+)
MCIPPATVVQEEIFGPVLVGDDLPHSGRSRGAGEQHRLRPAASVWSENINVALDLASQVKAGVVWVNCTNQFDAACGFGGYRESGYGREGGREGMLEYLTPKWLHTLPGAPRPSLLGKGSQQPGFPRTGLRLPDENREGTTPAVRLRRHTSSIDRTVKQYIGGKQARPDSGYSFPVYGREGELLGEAPLGNRKDIRNAVEAARNAHRDGRNWSAHNRAQVLYYIAENMIQRRDEIAHRLARVRSARSRPPSKSISPSSASSATPPGLTSTTARCTIRRDATSRLR